MGKKNPFLEYTSREEEYLRLLKYYFRRWSKEEYLRICRDLGFKESIVKTRKQLQRERDIVRQINRSKKSVSFESTLCQKKRESKRKKHFKKEMFLKDLEEGQLSDDIKNIYQSLEMIQKEYFLKFLELFSRDFPKLENYVYQEFSKNYKNTYITALARLAQLDAYFLNNLDIKLKGSVEKKFKNLVDHLLVKYKMPKGLYSCFFGNKDLSVFFMKLAQGDSFKKILQTRIIVSKKDSQNILKLMQKYSYDMALRMNQYQKAGLSFQAIQSFRKINAFNSEGTEFQEKLRWEFIQFIARCPFLDKNQIFPLWDYTNMRCQEENFRLLGRNPYNYVEQMNEWHHTLSNIKVKRDFSWERNFEIFVEKRVNSEGLKEELYMEELNTYSQLVSEGKTQKHCVASYASRCQKGIISICSLRISVDSKSSVIATIEVHLHKKAVVQARGKCNKNLDHRSLSFLNRWATRNNLGVEI